MSDLFFAARINDEAKKLGAAAVFVKDKAAALEQLKLNPALVIFDLNCASAEPLVLIAAMKGNSIPAVAFVAHVQTDLRQQAIEAGCDTVVARSVFAQNLASIMESSIASR